MPFHNILHKGLKSLHTHSDPVIYQRLSSISDYISNKKQQYPFLDTAYLGPLALTQSSDNTVFSNPRSGLKSSAS